MAPPADLREWIRLLEGEGELVRIAAEVDPDLEITEIVDRTVKSGGPALLFENPKGSDRPLLINQFGTERRMCMAFGVERLDDVARKLEDVLEMQPPQGLAEKVRGLKKLKSIADSRPKTVSRGASQEIVLTGDDVDLGLLPIQRCWPGDPAPFITLPAVITKDPHTGVRNVGMYRMQKIDARSTYMHWQIHKDGRADYLATDGQIPVAVALGLDPVTAYSASAPLPERIDEFMLAASSRASRSRSSGRRRSTSRCPPTPRSCSRGRSRRARSGSRGRSATTPATTRRRSRSRFRLSAITMRRDAIYPSIVVGKPVQEDAWLGKATERIFLPAIKMTVPEIVDYDLPVSRRLPQLRDRLDPEGVPRPRAQGDARDLGAGDAQPLEVGGRRRRARERARLRGGLLLRRRQRRPEARRRHRRGPLDPPRPRARAAVRRRQARDRRDREAGRGRCAGMARRRSSMSRGGSGARRPPLGRVRDTDACRRGFGTEWLSPRVAAADTSLTARQTQGLNPET